MQPPKQVRLVVLPNPGKELEKKNSSLTPHPSNWCKKARQTKKKHRASCWRAPAGKENRMRGMRGAYRSPAQIIFKHKKVSSVRLHSGRVPAFKHNVQGQHLQRIHQYSTQVSQLPLHHFPILHVSSFHITLLADCILPDRQIHLHPCPYPYQGPQILMCLPLWLYFKL